MKSGSAAVVGVLLLGIAIGYLGRGGVVSAPPAVTSADRDDSSTSPGTIEGGGAPAMRSGADPSSSRGPGLSTRGVGGGAPGGDERDGVEGDEQATVVPVLEVSVAAGEGTPKDWGAIAYVLPAGAHGVDRVEDVPHQSVSLERAARIPVLMPGLYDVVVRTPFAAYVERDVRVGREDAAVRVVLPPMAPVTFRVTTPPPARDDKAVYRAAARLESNLEKGVAWPGRSDALKVRTRVDLDLGGAETESPPVPLRSEFAVRVSLLAEEELSANEMADWEVRDVELAPSKSTAHGGDTITLAPRPGGRVSLTVKSDVSTWPTFPVDVGFGFERKSDGRWETESLRLADLAAAQQWVREGARVVLPEGTWSVEWGNHWIESGRADDLEVRAGATASRTVDLRARRVAEEEAARLEIEVDPSFPGVGGAVVWKNGRQDAFTFAHASVPAPRAADDEAIVAFGRDYASAPVVPPSRGAWRPRLERAGALVVALDRQADPAFGRVALRRADGFPIGIERAVGADEFQPEPEVAPGTVLGPFAPGTVRFEVLLGGQRLRTVDVLVRAGRIETLRVALPRTAFAK